MRRFTPVMALLFSVLLTSSAQAGVTLTATRQTPGSGADTSSSAAKWAFRVDQVTGNPSQALLTIQQPDANGDGHLDFYGAGFSCNPAVGKVCKGSKVVPAGTYQVALWISGGSHRNASDSVTVTLIHP